MSGELSKEFRQRVTGNILHVVLEELVPRRVAVEPPMQLQVALCAGTG